MIFLQLLLQNLNKKWRLKINQCMLVDPTMAARNIEIIKKKKKRPMS